MSQPLAAPFAIWRYDDSFTERFTHGVRELRSISMAMDAPAIDPTTEEVRSVRVCVRLGLESQMTKLKARDALKAEIAKQTGQLADGRVLKDGSVTFEWFVPWA